MGARALEGMYDPENVCFESGSVLETIGDDAFRGDYSLTDMTPPDTVVSNSSGVFMIDNPCRCDIIKI